MIYEDLLAHIQTFAQIDWPGDEKYAEAEDATFVASWLIQNRSYHESLRDAKIKVLFKKDLGSRGTQAILGKAKAQDDLQRKISPEVEFVLLVNWTYWNDLKNEYKIILVDHELCHMEKLATEKGLRLKCLPHDFEEFATILKQYGDQKVLNFHNLTTLLLEQKKDDKETGTDKESTGGDLNILDEA